MRLLKLEHTLTPFSTPTRTRLEGSDHQQQQQMIDFVIAADDNETYLLMW